VGPSATARSSHAPQLINRLTLERVHPARFPLGDNRRPRPGRSCH
jgi:hypothetical protein